MGISDHVSGNTFKSQLNSAILHHKKWLKYQGTPHGAAEIAGACQDAVREEGKTKNASGECGCWAAQAGSGLQAGAVVMVICNFDLVLCLSAAPTCPAHRSGSSSASALQPPSEKPPKSQPRLKGGGSERPDCTVVPGCSHLLSSQSTRGCVAHNHDPCGCEVLWYKAVREWM